MTSTRGPRTTERDRSTRPGEVAPSGFMGIILVVVAVALGVILLVKGGGVGFDDDSRNVAIGKEADQTDDDETTTTTGPPSETSVPAAELKIAVLNAAGKAGFAGLGSNFLSVAGYPSATAGNAAGQEPTSAVYFAPGFEADATAVAKTLSIGEVSALPDAPLGKTADDVPEGTAVVVVLGPDAEPVISASDTAPADGATEGAPTDGAGSGTSTGD